jgi:predicted ATPase/DNA-binding CsgD family transcriptional regulator
VRLHRGSTEGGRWWQQALEEPIVSRELATARGAIGSGGVEMDRAATGPGDRRAGSARSSAPRWTPGPGRRAALDEGLVTPLRAIPVGPGRATGVPRRRPNRSIVEEWPHNLPHPLTSFIGREREIAEARRLLDSSRLLTLTGTGGVGKTRLGHEVAAGLLDRFQDGVWLVELASLADPTLVPRAVATVLGVREGAERSLTVTLADALRAERLLLVLDNCEHLVEACAEIADALLRSCPDLRILATSRQPLGILGETTFRVPSLPVSAPPDASPVSACNPDEIHGSVAGPCRAPRQIEPPTESEAVRLFVERARAAVPTFTLTDRNVVAVEQICQRLDGIPLAIELAAARVGVLSPEQIAARLGDRFGLLTGGSRTALPRYQTLRALLDWSHDLLDEGERVLLRRLAVFAGGWTLEAAESVCAFGALTSHGVLDLLSGLVAKSLVLTVEHVDEIRYRFLETPREYAAERLRETDEETVLRERHRDWIIALAERAQPELTGPDQEIWLERLERDRENLRAAKRWADARGDSEAVVRLGAALCQFWLARADAAEAREWVDAILGMAPTAAPVATLARALHGAGALAIQIGDYTASRTLLEEATCVARRHGDRPMLAHVLGTLGRLEFVQGRYAESHLVLDECLAISREVDDRGGLIRALSRRGFVEYIEGRQESARTLFGEGLVLARAVGDHAEVAEFLNNLGNTHHVEGDFDCAIRMYQAALTVRRKVGDGNGLAWALNDLGYALALRGELAAAREPLFEALTLARRMGNRRRLAFTLSAVAVLAAAAGQAERAVRLAAVAEAAAEAIGAVRARPMRELWSSQVGAARRALGNRGEATAVAAGRALTLDQAVDEALAWLAEPDRFTPVGVGPAHEEPLLPVTVPPVLAAAKARSAGVGLTPREHEVASLIARGLSNRQIGAALVIAEGTAANHVKHILARLGLDSRVQIAAWAIEHGLHLRSPA